LTIDYLKTTLLRYRLPWFLSTQIIFKDFTLTDELKNKATLDGFLAHRNYHEFRINLDSDFKNFQLLNTSAKDNNLFLWSGIWYGKCKHVRPAAQFKNISHSAFRKGDKDFYSSQWVL